LFVVGFVIAPSSQGLEPPANPVRFMLFTMLEESAADGFVWLLIAATDG
jgi:hypothetical protein